MFEKTVATLGSFLLLYITTERYILPKLYDPNTSDLRVSIELLLPFMTNYLLIFYIIFECILNGFAEISRYVLKSHVSSSSADNTLDLPIETFMTIGGIGNERMISPLFAMTDKSNG